jgi:hypothetical protein
MATKKEFEDIAKILSEARVLGIFTDNGAHREFTNVLAEYFEDSNPRFNRSVFFQASGVVAPEIEQL